MSMLPMSSGELSLMRDVIDVSLPGTAVLQSPSAASDGQGGQVWTYAAAGTVNARLMPIDGDESALADRLGVIKGYILTVPANTTVTETYRAVFDSRTLEIKAVLPRVPWEISRRMLVAEVT